MTTDDAAYEITTDLERMDLDRVHHWLSTDAYWSLGRSRETVETAARGSLSFAVLRDGTQVAYARVVTDRATFAWLCDVYVDPEHRGRGLGSRLVGAVLAELRPLGLRRVMLATQDAHEVYARAGFAPLSHPGRWMELNLGQA